MPDGGAVGGAGFDGFDPGDEPLDEVVESSAAPTSEQQAVRLLAERLGAEPIGDRVAG